VHGAEMSGETRPTWHGFYSRREARCRILGESAARRRSGHKPRGPSLLKERIKRGHNHDGRGESMRQSGGPLPERYEKS